MNDDFESKEEGEASVFEGCVLIVIGIIFLIVILGVISEGRVTKPITDKLAETIKNNPEFFLRKFISKTKFSTPKLPDLIFFA